jgi:hypothetical protein
MSSSLRTAPPERMLQENRIIINNPAPTTPAAPAAYLNKEMHSSCGSRVF